MHKLKLFVVLLGMYKLTPHSKKNTLVFANHSWIRILIETI